MDCIKIKLIAVAKDEAAYLPNWIFHHLYVGFDVIDIYVNNTTDNTWQVAKKLRTENRVNFIDGDYLFKKNPDRPQEAIYKHALKSLSGSEYTHAMFLDIDEFWLSKDVSKGIKDVVQLFPVNAVIGFAWFNRANEKLFDNAISSILNGYNGSWVKSIFPLCFDIDRVDVHSVKISECDYYFANGYKRKNKYATRERNSQEGAARYTAPFIDEKPLESFILHRMYRSEKEYVSLLGRGNPNDRNRANFAFKDNRNGYLVGTEKHYSVEFDLAFLSKYNVAYDNFLTAHSLSGPLELARDFVLKRFDEVVGQVRTSSAETYFTLQRILRNVELEEVLDALQFFSERTKSKAYILKAKLEKTVILDEIKTVYQVALDNDQNTANQLLRLIFRQCGFKGKKWSSYQYIVGTHLGYRKKHIQPSFSNLRKLEKDAFIRFLILSIKRIEKLDIILAIKLVEVAVLLRPNGMQLKEIKQRLSKEALRVKN